MSGSFKIGELAKRTGLSVQAIRYYEAEGLVLSRSRSEKGYRQFDETAVDAVELIKYYKALGFSLKEIKVLLTYERSPEKYCAEAQKLFNKKSKSIQEAIRRLSGQNEALEEKLSECETCEDKSDCKVLKKNAKSPKCAK